MNLRDHLQAVYDQRGALTPSLVVDTARDGDHPLHSRFEWDDSVAGEKFRRVQAAELIRSVRIAYASDPKKGDRSVRAFLAVPIDDGGSRTYMPTEAVVQDEFLYGLTLRECEREIGQLKNKYGHLREFADLIRKATA